HVKDVSDFFADLEAGHLPAVAFVKPDSFLDGHPASSKLNLFEAMVDTILDRLQAQGHLWRETALFIALDEGGGFCDSGLLQPVEFCGDGPRIHCLVVSPYAQRGRVAHTYYDRVSVLKLIERNWPLAPLTARSRDNLPNPIPSSNPYGPLNTPAIGDLFEMFEFG